MSQARLSRRCTTVCWSSVLRSSKLLDYDDRRTCDLFGDGAGAVVLQSSDEPTGLLTCRLGSDSGGRDALCIPGGGSKHLFCQKVLDQGWPRIGKDGKRILKFAIRTPAQPAFEGLAAADLSPADVSLLIPQQCNVRLIRSIRHQRGLPEERAFVDVDMCGNMSLASIPVTLCEAVEEGRKRLGIMFSCWLWAQV